MSRIVSPTRESLQMAIELSLKDKIPHGQLIPTAALLDGYLSGIVAVDISFDENGRPVVQINEGQRPESADEAERDESVSDARQDNPARLVINFVSLTPDELRVMQKGEPTPELAKTLAAMAFAECHRRWGRA